jgi:hypothetical protein
MKRLIAGHDLYVRFVICLVAFFLLFMGIRLPDFSRAPKPKPMRRAMLDNQNVRPFHKAFIKVHLDPVVIGQTICQCAAPYEFVQEPYTYHSFQSLLSIIPLPSRAPPAA